MVNFLNCKENSEESCKGILEVLSQDFQDVGLREKICSSVEDQRALEILNKTVDEVGNHYSVRLLWKDENVKFPNNRKMALMRLKSVKKKFLADSNYFKNYCEKINEYLECGYAVPVTENRSVVHHRVNYIPHHGVSTASKFRVVFDRSAKFCGKSLNDNLLGGPDLTCNLLAVLLRFRKWPIAVVADIKAMFSQMFVDKRDQDAFRFLWYPDDDLTEEPVDFRMRTHVFGAESSPCCAAVALLATAKDNLIGASEDVVSSVFKNVYVDDVCCSYKSTDIAIDSASQMRKLLKSGGFYLTKFSSNSEDRARDVHLNDSGLPAQKTLGVYWYSKCDRLLVRVGVRQRPCTRRGVMSMIAQT